MFPLPLPVSKLFLSSRVKYALVPFLLHIYQEMSHNAIVLGTLYKLPPVGGSTRYQHLFLRTIKILCVPFYNENLVELRILQGTGLVCHSSIRGQL